MHTRGSRFPERWWPAALLAVGGAAGAQAQEPTAETGTLEVVTVTARKVAENLQDTPIAITALSGESLENRQVFSTENLTEVVPNLQFAGNAPLAGNNSSSQVFIRGIGQTDPTSTVDPGVGLYIDDVYIGNAVGAKMELLDIDNVQVLRGPQGTLFGRNTIGGAILLSTKDPGKVLGGTVKLGGGSDSLFNAFLAGDLPISDTFGARFTAGMRKQDGYVTRASDGTDLGDTNTYTLTSKFVWKPSEQLTGKFLADYTHANENGSPLVFAAITPTALFARVASSDAGCPGFNGNPNALPAVPNINDPRCANNFQKKGPFKNGGTDPLTSRLTSWGGSLNVAYDLTDQWTLKSISSYRDIAWQGNRDADNTPLVILGTQYDVHGSQWSQEFQGVLQTEKLTGVLGVYYFKQKSDDIATVILNTPAPGIQFDSDNNKVDNKSWAAFTQWTYNFTSKLGATVGGRYTQDDKGSYPDQYAFSDPATKQVPERWYRDTFSDFTPSASVSYKWTRETLTYLSYSEGFKGGGWNSHFNAVLTEPQIAALQEFKPEKARTIEAGFKLDLLGRTLRLNGAVFTSDYKDMQITYRGPAPNGVAPFLTNAGKASIDGFELETIWAPIDAWTLDASVGYLDASIDRLDIPALAVIPPGLQVGNALPYAPKWQVHAGTAYTARFSSFEVTPRVDASYQSETFFDATNTPEIAQLGGVTTMNVSVVIGQSAKPWKLTLGVNNATDKVYPVAGNSSLTTSSGYAEIAYARPREYFGLFTYDF